MVVDLTKARTCASCKHADKHKQDFQLLICRRRPPTPQLIPGPGNKPMQVNLWPPVTKEDWCGDHEWKAAANVN